MAAAAAGWGWAALLIAFFVASSALTRVGAAAKTARTGSVVAKGGQRDATQVAANGAVFGLAALGMVAAPAAGWWAMGAGALAAAAADTWATEIGTLTAGQPRSLRTGRPVAPGTSGGVSWPGSVAGMAGAAAVGLGAITLGAPAAAAVAAVIGGVTGMLVDSLLGATVQARRRCAACGTGTERIVHDCGHHTEPAGGLRWLDNDVVNLACTVSGAAIALTLYGALR